MPGKNALKTMKTKFVLYSVLVLPIQRKMFFHQISVFLLEVGRNHDWKELNLGPTTVLQRGSSTRNV